MPVVVAPCGSAARTSGRGAAGLIDVTRLMGSSSSPRGIGGPAAMFGDSAARRSPVTRFAGRPHRRGVPCGTVLAATCGSGGECRPLRPNRPPEVVVRHALVPLLVLSACAARPQRGTPVAEGATDGRAPAGAAAP